MTQNAYLVALQLIDGLGPGRIKMLLDFYQTPQAVWESPQEELLEFKLPQQIVKNIENTRQETNPQTEFQRIIDQGIQVVSIHDPEYPSSLKEIYHPPVVLYIVGKLPSVELAIGVVGTRKISGYGKAVTHSLTAGLVEKGFCIISGLARGVDTVAHQTAIEYKGKTVAVLGGGLNQIFPAENIQLAKKIAHEHGAVISEYHPDAPSLPGNFPARNRIIAGLSQAVLVTEATKDSGSLITAKVALDQGKIVYAVPGPITTLQSEGPHELIRDGATLVRRIEDILPDFGHIGENKPNRSIESLSTLEYQIITQLAKEKAHLDELTRLLGQPSAKIASSLLKLEIAGFIFNEGNGVFVKNL